MSSKFLSVLAGVALAASATSAFAFEAVLSSPKALHTRPCASSGVIEVLAPTTVINIAGCRHGWCQAQAPNGPVGFVYTPVLVGAAPAPGWWWGWGAWTAPWAPVAAAPAAAPVATAALNPFGLFDVFAPAPAPVPAPVVASY
jgi:hypothetical protein